MNARQSGLMVAVAVGFGLAMFTRGVAVAAEAEPPAACAALSAMSTPSFVVDTASWVEAGPLPAGPGRAAEPLPAHCLLRVVIDPRPSGIEELSYGTGIELRLPRAWNGRLLVQGGGGMNGVLNPAIGSVAGSASALARGFAVVSSDGGHRGRNALDARFGVDQQARLDFAYQAVQRTTREAKALVDRYYGRKPDRSYFMGCSTGGREALLVAQRLPLEFDGVVAGNAAFNFTRILVQQLWSLQTIARIAPRDASGAPRLHEAFSDAQLQAISNGALAACDALDGLQDGLINDFQACRFDPASLGCDAAGTDAATCLSAKQIGALHDIFGGARNSRGEALYGTFPFDTGIAQPVWRNMHLGTATSPPANATLGRDTMRGYIFTPPQPDFDPLSFDFDRDLPATFETAAINDAVATTHSTFAGRGSKLIIYHGLSDQAMAPGALSDWYERLTPRGDAGPQDWARLFMVPGMTHCGGGQATDEFDMLSAIEAWVEQGRAPDRVIASGKAMPGATRPLCPYPLVARHTGRGNDAASFQCAPSRGANR